MTIDADNNKQTHDGISVNANADRNPAVNVETLTAKAKSKNPRGTTRARSGRRLDFETPSDRATRAVKDSSGQNPDETVPPGAQPTAENPPPPAGSNEGGDFERIDLDISDQSDHSEPVRSAGCVVRKAHDRGRRKPLLGRAGRTGRESGSDPPQPTPTGSDPPQAKPTGSQGC
ncbi:hypothetical protein F2Q69_00047487 [Brassica cretica]|uniref:Uncharacterized protein n=1 Tax=Brassica cretica TaxID=69181 RepID=A0A8S9PEU9_BRACR|nr:hypothetical protein F2Q69_00047487 [Brassica cretica]